MAARPERQGAHLQLPPLKASRCLPGTCASFQRRSLIDVQGFAGRAACPGHHAVGGVAGCAGVQGLIPGRRAPECHPPRRPPPRTGSPACHIRIPCMAWRTASASGSAPPMETGPEAGAPSCPWCPAHGILPPGFRKLDLKCNTQPTGVMTTSKTGMRTSHVHGHKIDAITSC